MRRRGPTDLLGRPAPAQVDLVQYPGSVFDLLDHASRHSLDGGGDRGQSLLYLLNGGELWAFRRTASRG